MKKLISLALVAVMMLSLCLVNASADEPITIICYSNDSANNRPTSLEDDFVYQKILERTGVDFQVVYLDEYDTALNVRLMNDDDWHMFLCDADQLRTYASQDLLLPLSGYTDMLNTIYASYGEDTNIQSLYVDGEMYAVPAAKAISDYYQMILTRQDWNEKYGLTVPTTVDELYDYCYWLANNDPDGNGIKDTIGFTGWGINGLSAITAPYDVVLGNYVIVRDGKVTNSLLQPRMTEALEMCKKFFDNGLLDPEMFASNSKVKANVIACNVGVAAMPWSNILKAAYVAQYKEVNPEAEYTWINALSQGGDACYAVAKYDKYAGDHVAINADVTDEELEAIFKVLEYMCTEEGMMLVYMGLENEHWYRDESGTIHAVDDKDKVAETNYTHVYQLLGRNDAFYLQVKFPEAGEATAFGLETPRYIYYNTNVALPEDFNLADMEAYIKTEMLAFIKGERPISEYDAFLEELNNSYDFGTYMEIATEQLIEQGLATE